MSETYSDVDASADPQGAADWQDHVDSWPAVRAYKARTYALCSGVDRVLDVGSGTGVDLQALPGHAVGVDASVAMARRAAGRGCTVAVADGHALPFAPATFDAVRADRTLQHLACPEPAVDEFLRVLRPEGVLVVADADQESLIIEVPGVPADVIGAMRARRRDDHYRNGTFVRRVPGLLRRRGLHAVAVEAHPLVLTDPSDAFGIGTWAEGAVRDGTISPRQAQLWGEALARADDDAGFLYAVTFFVVSGRLPRVSPDI